MKSIGVLEKEHDNILKMLKISDELMYRFMEDRGNYDFNDIYEIIDFIRHYADGFHHKKEEDILFSAMEENITEISVKEPILGMYIEHDFARMYINNLESACRDYENKDKRKKLDIIGNMVAYRDLLTSHILKENTGIYKMAENMLGEGVKLEVDRLILKLEEDKQVEEKYLYILDKLYEKYIK